MRPSEWIVETRLDGDRPCQEAVEWLQGYTTMADAWRACRRGDWMIWALRAEGIEVPPAAIERIVARAIRRGQRSLRGVRAAPWATAWRRWARRWLSGEDRSRAAAWAAADAAEAADAALEAADAALAAADAAAAAAAWAAERAARAAAAVDAAERRLQARDLRRALPEWPEEETNASD